jgi:small-conductance mechanosensitive channel
MSGMFNRATTWLTTSGIKVLGILIALVILSQMSKWTVKWLEKFIPEKDSLQAAEAKKRVHTLGDILRHALIIVLSLIALLMILGELGIQLGPLLATAGIGAVAIGFGAQSLVKNVDQVMDILKQIGRELVAEEPWKSAILEPLQIFGMERFGDSQLVIRMVVKTIPLKQWEVGRELRRRIKIRFDEKGIEIPLPHRVLIWGEPKKENKD